MTQAPSSTTPSNIRPSNPKSNTALIVIALALGLIAGGGQLLYNKARNDRDRLSTFTVYRVNRPFRPGEKLSEKYIVPVTLPNSVESSFSTALTEQEMRNQLGAPFLRSVDQNQILTSDLFTADSRIMDIQITEGRRAMAIPVARAYAPASLKPGMMVDLHAPIAAPGKMSRTMLVMERVRVLAVGTQLESAEDTRRGSNYSKVDIEVTPEQALTLSTIINYIGEDSFALVIRNPADRDLAIPTGGINPEVLAIIEARASIGQ
jgi:Flp pilus assembly protein CpaB